MAVWPAEIGCSVGLSTDPECRVLDAEDRPIPGLYACGNDMGSLMSGFLPRPRDHAGAGSGIWLAGGDACCGETAVLTSTLTQKIIAHAAGRDTVAPGEIVTCAVDLAMIHDSGGPRRGSADTR